MPILPAKPRWLQIVGIAGYLWIWLGTAIVFFAPGPSRNIPAGIAAMATFVFASLTILAEHYARPRLDKAFRCAVAFSGVIAIALLVKHWFF